MAIPISRDEVSANALLTTFRPGFSVAVVGASGGIGNAFLDWLDLCPQVGNVVALSRTPVSSGGKIIAHHIDIEDETSVATAALHMERTLGQVDLVIVASGILHSDEFTPEKAYKAITSDALAKTFAVNAVGPALVAKHFMPLLPTGTKSVFAAVSARVGSIADNGLGGWYAYRASKAALNQLIRTLAIEVQRKQKDAVCLALHPGTTDTALSKPYQSGAPHVFTPGFAANRMLQVIDAATPTDSGKLVAWDGEVLPY